MKVKNITSGKVIGFGKDFTVLPGETREVPAEYKNSPAIDQYEKMKFVQVIGKSTTKKPNKPKEEPQTEPASTKKPSK